MITEIKLLRLKLSVSQLKSLFISRHFYLPGLVLYAGLKSVRLELLTSICAVDFGLFVASCFRSLLESRVCDAQNITCIRGASLEMSYIV